jgi:hypothetical protein
MDTLKAFGSSESRVSPDDSHDAGALLASEVTPRTTAPARTDFSSASRISSAVMPSAAVTMAGVSREATHSSLYRIS